MILNFACRSIRSLPSRRSGFTLIELLVVLGILGLMLALLPPFLPKVHQAQQAKAAARELAAGLRTARQQAVATQKPVALLLDVAERKYALSGQLHELRLPPDTELALHAASSEQTSASAGSIRFFPDGSATGGEIALRHATQAYVVQVQWLTGRVSVGE